jgi:hypothetical protein
LLADVIYTWGIPVSDMYGVLRRKDVKPSILPNRKGISLPAINTAIDELIVRNLLCQPEDGGESHLHWCFHDDYQGEKVRKGRGSPLFEFVCPNEKRPIVRDTARHSAAPRPTKTETETETKTKTKTQQRQPPPPIIPPNEPSSRSLLMEAVMAIWPGAGAVFFQGYTDLEDEYGSDFMWECWRAALKAANTKPSVGYLDKIARRCKAEGREPNERQELQDAEPEGRPDNRPTEIDGLRVIGWVAGLPILDAPAKAT